MYNRNNNTLAHIMWNRKYHVLSFFAFPVKLVLVILKTVTVAACSGVNSNLCGAVDCDDAGCCAESAVCEHCAESGW